MKNKIKTIAGILALMTFAALFAGCNNARNPADTTLPETTAEETAPLPESEPFRISSGGKSVVTVIRPDEADEEIINLAVKVRKKLEDKTGLKIDMGSDFMIPGKPHNADTYEILIGKTNYDETAAVTAGMRFNDYAVSIEGHKIVITGISDATVSKAVTWFCTTGLNKLAKDENGDYSLSFDTYRYDAGYKVESLEIAGTPITDFRFVYGKSSGRVSQAAAEDIASVLAQATGYLLNVVSDKEAPTGHEILIGETNRLSDMKSDKSGYMVYLNEGNLVLDAQGPLSAEKAIRALYSEKLAAGGKLNIGTDLNISGKWLSDSAEPLASDADIRVMSYNILTEKWGGTDTSPRAERLGAMLDAYSPDIVGIQEVCSIWVKYIPIYCGDYAHVCLVRPDGGENYSTVLYKKDKYELVDSGVIPYSMSANVYCRNMGWAVLRDKATGKNVAIISTHWDFNDGEINRDNYRKVQAEELSAQVKKLQDKYNCPVFTTGDYNTIQSSGSMNYFRSINNMWCWKFDSLKMLNNYGSASNLGTLPGQGGNVIDYVFGTKDTTPLQSFVVVNFDTANISDHQPVITDVKFN
ncbi:MAG: endonuclease/exonuclease/phosphatase family protein [Clostridia bacterium]|nr:endonuclease/exonuclease/phosphatase family protein [Clostridia bacterium]